MVQWKLNAPIFRRLVRQRIRLRVSGPQPLCLKTQKQGFITSKWRRPPRLTTGQGNQSACVQGPPASHCEVNSTPAAAADEGGIRKVFSSARISPNEWSSISRSLRLRKPAHCFCFCLSFAIRRLRPMALQLAAMSLVVQRSLEWLG